MKIYKALVWVGDQPSKRVEVEAQSGDDAMKQLRAEYGDDAVISLHDDESAKRIR